MILQNAIVRNFRAFSDPGVELRFCPITLIIGSNGSGKSSLLYAIRRAIRNDVFNNQDHSAEFSGPQRDLHRSARVAQATRAEVSLSIEGDSIATTRTLTYHCQRSADGNCKQEWVWQGQILPSPPRELTHKVFNSTFPRQISASWLGQTAFGPDRPGANKLLFGEAEHAIREQATKYLRIPQSRLIYQGDLRHLSDSNGVEIVECSDGKAHFLFLIAEVSKHKEPTAFLIDEPDAFMHPELQKNFLAWCEDEVHSHGHQFVLTTHSPYLVSACTGRKDAAVYALSTDASGNARLAPVGDKRAQWEFLRSLGHAPSDVLQPNGVIWVEGPSDAVYLHTWIDTYVAAHSDAVAVSEIVRGRDYEIIWFGGGCLPFLGVGLNYTDEPLSESGPLPQRAVLDLLSLNNNACVLLDRDTDSKKHENLNRLKDLLENACRERKVPFLRTEPASIEGYLDSQDHGRTGQKMEQAFLHRLRLTSMSPADAMAWFGAKPERGELVAKLVETIRSWMTSP